MMYRKNNDISQPNMKSSSSCHAGSTEDQRHKSQPIKFKMKRTDSEIQLKEEEEAAKFRDYCMYMRVMSRLHGERADVHPFESDIQAQGNEEEFQPSSIVHPQDFGCNLETDSCSYDTPPAVHPTLENEKFDLAHAPKFFMESINVPNSKFKLQRRPESSKQAISFESDDEGIFDIEL